MPMTLAQWNEWPVEKREFYAKLFTCYSISDDDVVCIDSRRRQLHVQEQLIKQDQKIIPRSTLLANYILTNGIDKKSENLKVDMEHNISCLLLTSEELSTNKYKLAGGFWLPTQDIPDHFETVVKQKIGLEYKIARSMRDQAFFIPLGAIDDLTVISSCVLDPSEIEFLLHDPLFMAAIENEVQNLSKINPVKLPADIKEKIIKRLHVAAAQGTQQASLLNLNVPNVSTYWVLYNQAQFKSISKYLEGVKSSATMISLDQALCCGSSKFLFLSEYINLLKIALWSYGLDGKSPDDVNQIINKPILDSELKISEICGLFQSIATKQLQQITTTNLPLPPCFMGTTWGLHCSRVDLLKTLRNFYYVDLFTIAEIVGFRKEEAHLAFGLASTTLLDKVEEQLNDSWHKSQLDLLDGVDKFIKKMDKVEAAATPQACVAAQGLFGRSEVKKETLDSHDLSGAGFKSSL
jgi:hypothetical protein